MATTKSNKNSLNIRLTESVVFLRAPDAIGRRRANADNASPAMLRGLLVLDLVKPTRIKSIEVELQGKSSTAWPEGVGARRIEITEEHKVFSATTVFFRAGATPASSSRRTLSVGPGLSLYRDPDDEALTEGFNFGRDDRARAPSRDEQSISREPSIQRPTERTSRRQSMDQGHYQRDFVSHHEDPYFNTPPYTPRAVSPAIAEVPSLSPRHSSTHITGFTPLDEGHSQESEGSSQPIASTSNQASTANSSASSLHSFPRDASQSRRQSMEEDPDYVRISRDSRDPSRLRSSPPAYSPDHEAEEFDFDGRGRKHKRFSFAAVSHFVMDAMRDRVGRSSSPIMRFNESRDRMGERSVDRDSDFARGRTLEKGKERERTGRSTLGRVGEVLGFEGDEDEEFGDGWKEFKKGTYTYPISFSIPANSPPTLHCDYGSVTWRLKAYVHRPGAFTTKLTASREVTLVSCPEEDAEDTENIIVERAWDNQMQYFIAVSGRTFHIGGTTPIQITMMPLEKIKVYRISVILEERIDYLSNMKKVARTDPIQRITLLSLKGPGDKDAPPILPLDSDDPEAFQNSPMYAILTPDDDPSEVASSLMGPGPWSFHQELQLPMSCDELHFTNKNKKSNIAVTHTLKIIFRVERGDDKFMDQKTGKRKMFDIVVQTPVHILSCLCNPEWTALPPYAEDSQDILDGRPRTCLCPGKGKKLVVNLNGDEDHTRTNTRRPSPFFHPPHSSPHPAPSPSRPMLSRRSTSSESLRDAAGNPWMMNVGPPLSRAESLVERSAQFERLIAGQESELGEAPPAYSDVAGPSRA